LRNFNLAKINSQYKKGGWLKVISWRGNRQIVKFIFGMTKT